MKHTRDFLIFQYMTFPMNRVMGFRDYEVLVSRGYGLQILHVLGLIWLWGYRYIEFSDFSKCFLKLRRNSDVLESNGSRIRFQREKIHGNFIAAFFVKKFLFVGLYNQLP